MAFAMALALIAAVREGSVAEQRQIYCIHPGLTMYNICTDAYASYCIQASFCHLVTALIHNHDFPLFRLLD